MSISIGGASHAFTIDRRRLGASAEVIADHDRDFLSCASTTITLPMLGKQLGPNVSDLAPLPATHLRVTME
ncbi:MAG TPA: hypothetical protein VKB85_01230 [Propionibacteriaceae bacterium]|nr:hypothetical protein [Propionibacteriaceae bacterium]